MPLDPKMLEQLGSFDPSANAIAGLFTMLGKLDPNMAKFVLASFDEKMLEKMAKWSEAFAKSLNAISDQPDVELQPGLEVDFDKVMAGTEWQGEKLSWSVLENAQNQMVKALKAKNYLEAIKLGMSLSGVLTGGAV